VGFGPIQALQSVKVVNGVPGFYSDAVPAIVMNDPAYDKHEEFYVTSAGELKDSLSGKDLEDDGAKCVSKWWRKRNPKPFVGEFSIGNAKRAGLWGKDTWASYPDRMLKWRAGTWAVRDGFPGALKGMKTDAELHDLPIDVTATRVEDESPRVIDMPVRRSEKNPAASSEPTPPVRATDSTSAAGFDLTTELPPEPSSTTAPSRGKGASKSAPATKAAAPARPAAESAPQRLESLVITETAYVTPKDEDPFYEVRATVQKDGAAPIAYVFVTRDKGLYDLAESAEGTPQTFDLTWIGGERKDKSKCKVLTAIVAA